MKRTALFIVLVPICLLAALFIFLRCDSSLMSKMERKYDEICIVKIVNEMPGSNGSLDEVWWLMEDKTYHYLYSDCEDYGERDEYERTMPYTVDPQEHRLIVGDYIVYCDMDSLSTFVEKASSAIAPVVEETEDNEEEDAFFYNFSFHVHVEKVEWARLKVLFGR